MEFNKYFQGSGIEVSRTPSIENIKHIFVEPNNLYSLRDFVPFESLDFIYSNGIINETKFYKILIKEWMNFCKVRGYIIIDMIPNQILNFKELIDEIELFSKNKVEIIYRENGRVILKKTSKILNENDSIDKWTFGIIVDGRRDVNVDRCIESIINLKIPYFEIIICGKYEGKKSNKVKHISFEPKIGWITKKKNLICENAKFENLIIVHDRYIFDKDWFEGMKIYGNYFEILSCIQNDLSGNRVDDWITYGLDENGDEIGNLGFIDYKDWDINGFIGGGLYIIKKSVWRKCKWNETLVWGQGEDLDISRNFLKNGFLARFNPFSICVTISERGRWVKFKYNPKRFILPKDRPLKDQIKNGIKRFCRKYILN